ncbi:MAG: MaoC family dehydratase [Lachnospiraceae bacterium]|nr:MaoC family dehydratase [Lachnospiraceae bacterium]
MNTYTIESIETGMTASFTQTVTAEWFEHFLAVSGDDNPLHTDAAFAKEQGYRDRVLYGLCTAALYSRLAGVYLPGRYCLLQQCDVSFVKPVFAGDVLTVSGTVQEKDERFARVKIKAEIRNAEGKKVSRATLYCGFLHAETE